MSTHAIPDPAAAIDRLLHELGRHRWHEGVIDAHDAHEAVCNALYGVDASGQPCDCTEQAS